MIEQVGCAFALLLALAGPQPAETPVPTASPAPPEVQAVVLDATTPEMEAYIRHAYWLVRGKWLLPKAAQWGAKGIVVVQFGIRGDGTVRGLRVAESSGNDKLDRAALRAIERSSPLPPPPLAPGAEEVGIRWRFLYNVREAGEDPSQWEISPGNDAYWLATYTEYFATRRTTYLVEKLRDEDWKQRVAAAGALGKRGAKAREAIPALETAADDPDERVRAAAKAALQAVRRGL